MAKKTLGFVELEWVCPNCSTKNQGSHRTCISCGSPQSQDVAFEQAAEAELEVLNQDEVKIAEGSDIHCAFCGARNPAKATVCSQCGADLLEGTKREVGKVLGAFQSEKAEEIPCPHCGTLNHPNAPHCTQCGGSLPQKKSVQSAPVTPRAAFKPIFAVLMLVMLLICGLLAWWIYASNRTEATIGGVQNVQWERTVLVEALAPVKHENWKDSIPSDGTMGECNPKQRKVSELPVPNATEECGTPYTMDTGTGKGEVVQDCQYLVYDLYCQYTQLEWSEVDRALLKGEGLNVSWPQPSLSSEQRLGEKTEAYTIFFDVRGKTYPYTTKDYALFEQCKPHSQWVLNINTFDKVVSVEAAK